MIEMPFKIKFKMNGDSFEKICTVTYLQFQEFQKAAGVDFCKIDTTSKENIVEYAKELEQALVDNFIRHITSTSRQKSELGNNIKVNEQVEKIKELLINMHKTTLVRISEAFNLSNDQVLYFIEPLILNGIISERNPVSEIICNRCNSANMSLIRGCPMCFNLDFKKINHVEHYPCGAVIAEQDIVDDKCPTCKKQFKALGVDYKIISTVHMCKVCNNEFSKTVFNVNCVSCDNKFSFDQANWIASPSFVWNYREIASNHDDSNFFGKYDG